MIKFLHINVCLFLLNLLLLEVMSTDKVAKEMESNEIVPDILDTAPENFIEVTYPSGATVNLGNELTPTEVKDIPNLQWEADEQALYTLLLTDLDAPSRQNPKYREVRHWLVVNIPGNNISKGQTIYEYVGSGPPLDSGLHRYVFLVFKQKYSILSDKFVSNRSREGRLETSTKQLAAEYDLGVPIAGNFYQAQYDDYVPVIHQQLGGVPPN